MRRRGGGVVLGADPVSPIHRLARQQNVLTLVSDEEGDHEEPPEVDRLHRGGRALERGVRRGRSSGPGAAIARGKPSLLDGPGNERLFLALQIRALPIDRWEGDTLAGDARSVLGRVEQALGDRGPVVPLERIDLRQEHHLAIGEIDNGDWRRMPADLRAADARFEMNAAVATIGAWAGLELERLGRLTPQ